ncbi:MAG: cobalt ECF transporter T component CbiQ [Muribaculaceae bacterium]|nr:cobalt ECF transporter T component CbiQ [Muribaculaceae bacterium]
MSHVSEIDSRAILSMTLLYLLFLLSMPLSDLGGTIWFAVYPIIMAPLSHLKYARLFQQSLFILPLILLIAVFNPVYDSNPIFFIGNVGISNGWLTFFSLIVRGIIAFQALLILVNVSGFIEVCNSLRRLGVPSVLTTQLLMVYRYIIVLLEEALTMNRARVARGYGKRNLSIVLWAPFVGSLLVRSIERSRRIAMAMEARGFNGSMPISGNKKWNTDDTVYCMVWTSVFLILKFVDLSGVIAHWQG